ncbi:MAG TPA: hypothetical protein DCQ53_03900 [Alphaproteobacteria bacterium]|jgi:hypothetical protein|nr:hypothetical protein [Alphaproteobacteria bacterium]|tara:strand:- start:202 stop:390 length:189 start_codon:yes stop_codon:yes gene_type:complete
MCSIHELSRKDIVRIKKRLKRGDHQHDIAADYNLNQGRISEINTGKRFKDISPDGNEQPGLF